MDKLVFRSIFLVLFVYSTVVVTDAAGRFLGDIELLESVKESFVSRRNAIPSWFRSNVSPCNWAGINCNKLGFVTHIDLSGVLLPLELPFPELIEKCRFLKYLDLSHCAFTGTIPLNLWNVTSLESLDLSDNRLVGRLPPIISGLINLKVLVLDDNLFHGRLPTEIGKLENLEELSVRGNGFSGNLPKEIGDLSNLHSLDISVNSFSGSLPASLGKLANLVYLICSNAGLTGRIPPELGKCKRLYNIDLFFNSLSGPLPHGLASMEAVKYLFLDSNLLSGHVPEWISNWTQVETILLSNNQFSGPLPSLSLNFLSTIDLSSNNLSGEIPTDICNAAKSLSIANLVDNNLSGSIQESFCNCSNLTGLVLSANTLSGEIPAYLGDLQLATLELTKNNFFGRIPDQLLESKTLMEISFSNNYLERHIPEAIGNVSTLERLHLDNNLFDGSIPASLGKLRNLTNLYLHGNELTGQIPSEIFECTKLVSLDLGANRLTGPIPKSISQLKLLDNLVLSNNNLSGPIPDEICSGFQEGPLPDSEYVQHYGMLDLSNNALEGPIPESINKCSILTELWLQENRLNGSIPYGISTLDRLISLNLSHNSLTGFLVPQLFSMKSTQGIMLSHNKINGLIPDFTTSSLARLDLSYNSLTGPVPPSVFHIKSLQFLDISSNSLSGSLSIDSGALSSLIALNASNNRLSGALVDSIQNLKSLSVLDIHNNKLTGALPNSLSALAALTYLDISNNDFAGTFPCNICDLEGLDFVNFSSNSFAGIVPKTCDKKEVACGAHQSVLLSGHRHRHIRRATVIAVASCATIISMAILLFGIWKWRMMRQETETLETVSRRHFMGTELSLKKQKDPLSINIATFEHSLLRMNASDILSATDNFNTSHVIGEGGYGTVYKASLLPAGQILAVKRLNGGHFDGDREFAAEMETIGKVEHENLVPLLGYCVLSDEKVLIYKYMDNGSLDFWLKNKASSLDWHTRLKICLGSARGLAFLHHGFIPHIIHRDIKSSNILLDKNFEARVSDFGLARIISDCETHVSTHIFGTLGYIPPEYGQAMMATMEGDVYSFGVVMLELLTGKDPIGQITDDEGGNLVGWVRWMVGNSRECQVLDPYLPASSNWNDKMLIVLDIAMKCTSDQPWKRPTMLEVVEQLIISLP